MTGALGQHVAHVAQALDTYLPQIQAAVHAHEKDAWECVEREAQGLVAQHRAAREAYAHVAQEGRSQAAALYEEALTSTVWTKVHAFVLKAHAQEAKERLDVALGLERLGLTDASLPLAALEDLMERGTIPECAELFAYAETRAAPLTVNMVANAGKGLVLLRLCNELLRRLTKSYPPHAVLAGRILTFLSTHFPINERSGVNLKGDFHVENETLWEEVETPDAMEDEAPASAEAYASHPHFYALFWSIQQYFSRPHLLFEDTEHATKPHPAAAMRLCSPEASHMQMFQATADCLLSVLSYFNHSDVHPSKRARLDTHGTDQFFPKYLTEQPLLDYELSDVVFRRHILTQFLVVFQFLLGCTRASRERNASWANKLLLPPFELSESDEKWTRRAWRHVQTQIRDTGKDGKEFLGTLLGILRRESSWVQWKGTSAPALEKAPHAPLDAQAVGEKDHAGFQARLAKYPHALGTPALSMLWSDGFQATAPSSVEVRDEEGNVKTLATDGLEELEMPPVLPSLTSLSRSIHMEEQRAKQRKAALGPDAATDDAMVHIQNTKQSLAWRALRCTDKTQLHLMACMHDIDDIPGLLKAMRDEEQSEEFVAPTLHEADEEAEKAQRNAEAEAKEKEEKEQEEKEKAEKARQEQEWKKQSTRDQEAKAAEKASKRPPNEAMETDEAPQDPRKPEEPRQTEQTQDVAAKHPDTGGHEPGTSETPLGTDAERPTLNTSADPAPDAFGADAEHDTDDEAGDLSQMHRESSVYTDVDQQSNATPDADATFLTAPHGENSDRESTRESTPVPLRSES